MTLLIDHVNTRDGLKKVLLRLVRLERENYMD